MKKTITILLTLFLLIAGMPNTVYAVNSTPSVSIDEFTQNLSKIEDKYDYNHIYFSSMMFKNDSEFYYIDGDDYLLTDKNGEAINAVVKNNDLKIPFETVKYYCEKYVDKDYVNLSDLKELGFDVEFNNDTAVLSKPLQTNRLVVKSKRDIATLDCIDVVEGYNDLHIIQFDDEESTKDALNYYNKQRSIEFVEPDTIVSTQDFTDYEAAITATSGNEMFYDNHLSWGSEYIGVDDYIDYLGNISELPEITVGIIDTGVITDHEFLAERVIETGVNYSNSGSPDSEKDDNGHGTHVAGIVVDNTTSNVKIKGYKVLNSRGSGSLTDVCLGIDKAVTDGVNVINMSLGGEESNQLMTESVTNAINHNVIVCVAAGNNGTNANKFTPASVEGCITVAAIDSDSKIPYWTNYGSCVDIIAPGVNIYSSYKQNSEEGKYRTLSGTSMACPFVAAASALILSKYPSYNKNNVLEILQTNGRSIELPDRFNGVKVLYIGNVTEYDRERTISPTFSLPSGYYENSISVELSCSDENAEIYYTTDGTRASNNNGTLYTEPIEINKVTSLHAVAYSPNKLKSLQSSARYYLRYVGDENDFEIDENGTITAYNGNSDYLIIPEKIHDIVVSGIGPYVFERSSLVMIEFPDTLTHIDERSFYFCRNLKSLKAKNLTKIGKYALSRCRSLYDIDVSQFETVEAYGCHNIAVSEIKNDKLVQLSSGAFSNCSKAVSISLPNVKTIYSNGLLANKADEIYLPNVETLGTASLSTSGSVKELNLPKVTSLGEAVFEGTYKLKKLSIPSFSGDLPRYTFMSSGIESFNNYNIQSVGDYAFQRSNVTSVILKEATYIGEKTFDDCSSLKNVYLPKVTEIGYQAFREIEQSVILFTPLLVFAKDLPLYNEESIIFLSEKFNQLDSSWHTDQKCTIVAPEKTYAEEFAKTGTNYYTNTMKFVNSFSLVTAKGASIRPTDNGLRFGFLWDEIQELVEIADNIEYGFEYAYGETDELNKIKKANNYVYHSDDNDTTFNLVFTGVPRTSFDMIISARAYVNIDGMIFKSPILHRSFLDVANAALNDNTLDEGVKEQIRQALEA